MHTTLLEFTARPVKTVLLSVGLLGLMLAPPAFSQEIGPAAAESSQETAPPAFSLDELDALDALIEEDTEDLPIPEGNELTDLVVLSAFLLLALLGFLKKSSGLKYATMMASVVYLGFMKSNLVSVVHIFGLMEWSFPLFRYNLSWYLLMIFTIVSTVFWGRLYCGRICAFGALTQLMDKVVPSRFRLELPQRFERHAIYGKYALLVAAAGYFLLTRDNSIYRYIEPFWMFTRSGSAVMWLLLSLLLLTTVFIRNFYCRYLCPVGAALGLLSNLTMFRIKRWSECSTCKICEKACEWGAIDGPKVLASECVRCDDCEILYSDKSRCPHWLIALKNRALGGKARI